MGELSETEHATIQQCDAMVSGERCVLVSGHGGACVKPIPRQDMSDVIRHRIALDRSTALEAEAGRLRAALASTDQERDQWRGEALGWREYAAEKHYELPAGTRYGEMAAKLAKAEADVAIVQGKRDRLVAVIQQMLGFEWQPALTAAGTTNLFCPVCGGCPGSAAQNPRTQRADGHMIGKYLHDGSVQDGGCPWAMVCDEARAVVAALDSEK